MTAHDVFERVYELRPAVYDEDGMLDHLLTLENMVRLEIHQPADPDVVLLTEVTPETELSVQTPYNGLYQQYLIAQIDRNDVEDAAYSTDMALFNTTYSEYAKWYRRAHRPQPGARVTHYV